MRKEEVGSQCVMHEAQGMCDAGGLVIANELTSKTDFLTLTFGLTDGWWLFEDAERRMPGAPLLSRCCLCTLSISTLSLSSDFFPALAQLDAEQLLGRVGDTTALPVTVLL